MTKNIFNEKLEKCSENPLTGFFRDGYCRTNPSDLGKHTICSKITEEFLEFSKFKGNNLYSVVKPGDQWCLCEDRWDQAYKANKAPTVILKSTNKKTKKKIIKNILNSKKKNKIKNLFGGANNQLVSDLDRKFVNLAYNKQWSDMIELYNINKNNINIDMRMGVKINNQIIWYSALSIAILEMNFKVIKFLIKNNANPNLETSSLPLIDALRIKNKEINNNELSYQIIRFLIDSGANVNFVTYYGITPLAFILIDYSKINPEAASVHLNSTIQKIKILMEYNVDLTIGKIEYAYTPLMFAVATVTDGSKKIVNTLLSEKVIRTQQPHILNFPDTLSISDYVNLFNSKNLNALMVLLNDIDNPNNNIYCDIMITLLNHGTNPNTYYPEARGNLTLLAHLCKYGNFRLVSKFLEFKPDINLPNNDIIQETALFTAVKKDKHDIVKLLLNKGADLNFLNSKGNPAIHYVKSKEMFIILYNKKAKIDIIDKNGLDILQHLFKKRKNNIIKTLLEKSHSNNSNNSNPIIDLDKGDSIGFTILMYACLDADLELIKILVKYKADINLISDENRSCLYYSILSSSTDTFKFILDQKPNINIVDITGFSPINLIINTNELSLFDLLINDTGLDINYGGSRWNESQENSNLKDGCNAIKTGTPIIYSCKRNKMIFSKKLLNYDKTKGKVFNLNLNLYDSNKNTALMYAVINNNYELVQLILDYCKNMNFIINLNSKNLEDKNIFQIAENKEMIKILVSFYNEI